MITRRFVERLLVLMIFPPDGLGCVITGKLTAFLAREGPRWELAYDRRHRQDAGVETPRGFNLVQHNPHEDEC